MPQIQLNAHRFPNPILEIKECFIKQEILEINDEENAGQENVPVDKIFSQFKPDEEVIEVQVQSGVFPVIWSTCEPEAGCLIVELGRQICAKVFSKSPPDK